MYEITYEKIGKRWPLACSHALNAAPVQLATIRFDVRYYVAVESCYMLVQLHTAIENNGQDEKKKNYGG